MISLTRYSALEDERLGSAVPVPVACGVSVPVGVLVTVPVAVGLPVGPPVTLAVTVPLTVVRVVVAVDALALTVAEGVPATGVDPADDAVAVRTGVVEACPAGCVAVAVGCPDWDPPAVVAVVVTAVVA